MGAPHFRPGVGDVAHFLWGQGEALGVSSPLGVLEGAGGEGPETLLGGWGEGAVLRGRVRPGGAQHLPLVVPLRSLGPTCRVDNPVSKNCA